MYPLEQQLIICMWHDTRLQKATMWYDFPTLTLHLTQLVHDLSELPIKTPCKLITLDINLHVNIPISKILHKTKTPLDYSHVRATLSWQTVLIMCYIQPKLFSSVK